MPTTHKQISIPKCIVCFGTSGRNPLKPHGTRWVHAGICATLLRRTRAETPA